MQAVKVGICQVDGKWPNLALAKWAAWFKGRGETVERFSPLDTYDFVYASKVFSDTPDNLYLPPHTTLRGGTGYGGTALPPDVEKVRPDWSLWPAWKWDLGYSTRGCPNHCAFCVVPAKEGALRVVAEFGDLWSGRPRLVFHDNNATAAPIAHFEALCRDSAAAGVAIDFHQGLDARLITDAHVAALVASRHVRRIHFAFDSVLDEQPVRAAIATCVAGGITRSRLTFLMLVGFNSSEAEDLWRIDVLRGLGVDPFVMAFDRTNRYQRRLARWVNNKVAFKSMTWPEFQAYRG